MTSLTEQFNKRMDVVIGRIEVPLDGRFSSVRTQETNLGNFICDVLLTAIDADLVLLNAGTLRADRVIPAGEFKLRDLMNLLPMLDPLALLAATGAQIISVLENGVSQYPKLEG